MELLKATIDTESGGLSCHPCAPITAGASPATGFSPGSLELPSPLLLLLLSHPTSSRGGWQDRQTLETTGQLQLQFIKKSCRRIFAPPFPPSLLLCVPLLHRLLLHHLCPRGASLDHRQPFTKSRKLARSISAIRAHTLPADQC